jgi:hypothetical protein
MWKEKNASSEAFFVFGRRGSPVSPLSPRAARSLPSLVVICLSAPVLFLRFHKPRYAPFLGQIAHIKAIKSGLSLLRGPSQSQRKF